jgi:hypothetical protein
MVTRITMAFDLMNLLKKWCHILFVSKNDLLTYLIKTDIILLYLFCLHDRISKVVGAGNRFARSYFLCQTIHQLSNSLQPNKMRRTN